MIDTNALLKLLEEGRQLLTEYNVKWNSVLAKMYKELSNIYVDKEILEFLLKNGTNIYGGMGSLYDVFICSENGHVADDFVKANKKLDDYREKLSKEWQKLQKMLNK